MKQFLKQFFKIYTIPFFFFFSLGMHISHLKANTAVAQSQISVHDMFKDVPQDELLAMMEEGQQFIRYLEEHGTPEEKMAFAQAMEETLQGFTEEDWAEFEAIVETVQDKIPPLFEESKEVAPVIESKEQASKEPKIAPIIDNSLEKLFHAIHKAINAILLKAKSDKLLTERITITWDNKDNFNEMVRLLQVLNTKEHIAKLMTSKEEADKALLESIQNFNKRLQIENDELVIADTFGLQADEATTAENLRKLNIILEFFDRAIASLLPKLIKFVEAYEPLALKIAQEHDEQAKKALDHATKVEKQKRSPGQMISQDRASSNGSQQKPYNDYASRIDNYGGTSSSKEHPKGYLEEVHRNNLANVPRADKSNTKGAFSDGEGNKKVEDKKEVKKSAYDQAVDTIDNYLSMYGNQDVSTYATTINKAQNIFQSFGKNIDEKSAARAAQLQAKRASARLNQEDEKFLQKYTEQYKAAADNFEKNTKAAHSYYAELQDTIENIIPQIDEMKAVINSIKSSLDQMNSKELEQLNSSTILKNFSSRIQSYHDQFKNVQKELRNKHKLHRLEEQDARVTRDYDALEDKLHSLHGLDRKIAEARSQLDSLHKAIKSTIGRRKREENKTK